MPTVEFVLPSLGENITAGDVVRVLVKPGDVVAAEQPVLELETDKATIEVPSSVSGRVTDVRVKAGDKITVGQAVFAVEGDAPAARGGHGQKPAEAVAGLDAAPEQPADEAIPDVEDAPARPVARQAADAHPAARPAPEPAEGAGNGEAAAQAGPVEVKLPSLGENVTGGDVVKVLVQAGGELQKDQPIVELETDKATIEVPSPVAGTVREVKAAVGQKMKVGDVVLIVEGSAPGGHVEAEPPRVEQAGRDEPDTAGDAAEASSGGAAAEADAGENALDDDILAADAAQEDDEWPSNADASRDGDVVESTGGGGADTIASGGMEQRTPGRVRQRAPDKPGMHEEALAEAAGDTSPRPRAEVVSITRGRGPDAERHPAPPAPAAPSVRRMARELGADINVVPGNGPGGRISADDVKAYVKRVMSAGGPSHPAVPAAPPPGAPAHVPLPDFSRWGTIERKPIRAVRRKTAEHLTTAWTQIPHVTQHDKADITALEELRKRYGPRVEAAGGKLTVTAIALKVLASALKVFPQFNAAIDLAADELIYRQYVHIGVAVDTDRGLLVPVLRDVDRKNIVQIAAELAQASDKARTGKTPAEEMQGGCFTVTNLGGIGGTAFTPIVNWPEVAILGMSRASTEPVYVNGAFEPRLLLPLSLSYDHRVIDGADAIRFLRWVSEAMEQPFALLVLG